MRFYSGFYKFYTLQFEISLSFCQVCLILKPNSIELIKNSNWSPQRWRDGIHRQFFPIENQYPIKNTGMWDLEFQDRGCVILRKIDCQKKFSDRFLPCLLNHSHCGDELLEYGYYTCNLESSQKDESRTLCADCAKPCSKPKAFSCQPSYWRWTANDVTAATLRKVQWFG